MNKLCTANSPKKPEIVDQLDDAQIKEFKQLKKASDLFGYDGKIELCASLIELVRGDLIRTGKWDAMKNHRSDCTDSSTRKALLKTLIRISSESSNFSRTVDFVTPHALSELARKKTVAAKKLSAKLSIAVSPEQADGTGSTRLSHEHMVPCQSILLKIIEHSPDQDLGDLLKEVGFRALIYRHNENGWLNEHDALDKNFRSTMPPSVLLDQSFPLRFYPFARYEAAGVYSALRPVSDRGLKLWSAYELVRDKYLNVEGHWKYRD